MARWVEGCGGWMGCSACSKNIIMIFIIPYKTGSLLKSLNSQMTHK